MLASNAFREYLARSLGVRFLYKRSGIFPNVEVRPPATNLHGYVIANSYKVVLKEQHTLRIPPIEVQTAYKLYLGTEKDLGDATYPYRLFRGMIDNGELYRWL